MNRKKAYKEVYTILEDLNEEEYKKIPHEIIDTLKKYSDKEYVFELDEKLELKDHILLPETIAILFNIFKDYLSTPEQKEELIKMQNEEIQKQEQKKREAYSIDIFGNKNERNINKKQDRIQEKQIEPSGSKENILKKILNRMKKN